jgi:L-lactate dehydrogenase complex protein LldG
VTAREEVLARIRAALGSGAGVLGGALGSGGPGADGVPRAYRTGADLDTPALIGLLTERLRDYGTSVRRCPLGEVPATVRAALAERGARRVVVPPGLSLGGPGSPGPLLDGAGLAAITVITDDGLSPGALDATDGVITGAALAIAETGTIVLDGGPGQGRRALSLVPDYHLCLLHVRQIVAIVPQAVARLDPGRPGTWISGPSATSDIELERVQGVHGPRTLEVILAGP